MSTSRSSATTARRTAAAVGVSTALLLTAATPALAHVTAQPGEATQGGYTAIAFRVPNERPDSATVRIDVTLPAEYPLTSVRTKPMPGWTATVTKDGDVTSTITWTADPGVRIAPDQYQEFDVSMGPLPEGVDTLLLPTVQTYDSGEVVAWDQEPTTDGTEPDRPAPALTLRPSDGADGQGAHGAGSDDGATVDAQISNAAGGSTTGADSTARWLGGAGLTLGALGLGLGIGATARARKAGAR